MIEKETLSEPEISLDKPFNQFRLWERLPAAIDSICRIPESWLEATPTSNYLQPENSIDFHEVSYEVSAKDDE